MRIRSIRPEFWRSDDITALPRETRLLFVGLWSYVDDNGVGMDDFRMIAADLFALEDDQKEVRDYVREGLATLSRALLVIRYKVEGKEYLFIPTWDKHQRIDRASKARYPRPPEDWKPPTSEDAETADSFDEVSRGSRDSLDAGEGEKGRRGEGYSSGIADALPDADSVRPEVEKLCTHLRDAIVANGSKATITKRWRTEARLLIDRDHRNPDEAHRLIDWCQQHSFWRTNIMSFPKFREQYDRLRLQAQSAGWHLRSIPLDDDPAVTGQRRCQIG